MALDMVGVEFHEAGDQQVAVEVFAEARRALGDARDATVANLEAAADNFVREHDERVAEDLMAHGCSAGGGTAAGPKGWKA